MKNAIQTEPKDLVDVICNGSMRALAEIAERNNLLRAMDTTEVLAALRVEIKAAFSQTALDAHEALAMGEPMARASISADCVLIASRALKSCGYLQNERGH